jgi:hypothetical protein
MKNILERVLDEAPVWLGKFTQCLAHPRQVMSEHLQAEAGEKPVQDGVSFLILSFAMAAMLALALPVASMAPLAAAEPQGELHKAAVVLRHLFVFMGAAALVHGACKLVGVKRDFSQFFAAVARFGGVTLVLLALANAVTNVGMADPVVARNWQQMRQVVQQSGEPMKAVLCKVDPKTGQPPPGTDLGGLSPDSLQAAQALYLETVARPLYQMGEGIQLSILVFLVIWLGRVWWCYLRAHGLSTARALVATALGSAGLGAGWLLLALVEAGQEVSLLMQRCA